VEVEPVDFGLAKLEGFVPSPDQTYPVFKNPDLDFETGTSLCKLGFPFHSFRPSWDPAGDQFHLPPDALPMPRFPMDGILTRIVRLKEADGDPPFPFPQLWIETSTPGLKGQSGGPHIDVHGAVWGIQCVTRHFPLGFDPPVPNGKGAKEHQFLNVGMGVHPTTMFAVFDQFGVRYQVSDY